MTYPPFYTRGDMIRFFSTVTAKQETAVDKEDVGYQLIITYKWNLFTA
jgi:hypothetical protein